MSKCTKKSPKFFENIREVNGVKEKRCTICKEWHPETKDYYFMRNKSKPEKGFCSECKECSRERTRLKIAENPERHRKRSKDFRDRHADRYIAVLRQWRKDNPERKQEYQDKYYQENPDKLKRYQENRQHKNHNITKSEWENCKKYFDYKCAYCGLPLSEHYYTRKGITKLGDFHKEHVDHEGDNNLSNCIPSCGSCNDRKWKHPFDEWYNENNENFTQERYDKILKWLLEDYKLYIEPPKPKRKYNKRQK